jgi:hypothetical protein
MVTAATSIILSSSSGSLTLTPDEKGVGGWCQVHLLVSGVSRPLGAERVKYIASALLSFLKEPETKPGLRSVIGLSELHTCFYGEHVGAQAVVHLQDADAMMFAKLVLAPDQKKQWEQELSKHTEP